MDVVLACTWYPRGELARLRKFLPLLRATYAGICLVLPPEAEIAPGVFDAIKDLGFEIAPTVAGREAGHQVPLLAVNTPDWSWGRHRALELAQELPAGHIQYADLDRLLRWVETRPEEWRETLELIPAQDCLVVGRSELAYRTHPRALVQTESISNRVVSFLVGRAMDVSAGSKGFSWQAVQFLMANCKPGRALGTDGEWPVLLHRAGFKINYVAVDGLDWESADRFRNRAADSLSQSSAAEAYDADPENWERRTQVALEIVQSALEANGKVLERI
jgi:hypothetical protein